MRTSTAFLLLGLFTGTGCTHEVLQDPIDMQLLQMARQTDGFTWYAGSASPLARSSGSGHQEPLLRTRYNAIAAASLDSNLMVAMDTLFPEGSLVVKELMGDASTIATYAILLKQSANPNADASGWVWGYVRPNGEVRVAAKDRGAACRGCHTQDGHIDQTLMNISFP